VLAYALRRSPDLKGVIATSSGLHTELENQKAKLTLVKVLGSIAPTMLLPSGLDTSMLSHDPRVEPDYLRDPLVHDKISLGWGKAMLGIIPWTLAHAGEFPLPLLLMHGTADQIAFPSSSEEFAASAGGKATLVLWKDMYHETHNEPEKSKVIQTTIQWMDERLE
jgi:acylglycerol lipase